METIKKTNPAWKWPLVALAFFSLVGGSFAKVKQTHAQVAPPVVLPPETHNIVTVVGGGLDTGDGGQATLANLTVPSNVAFDAVGNMFIAETSTLQFPPSPSYHRIRKVDMTTGIITTVAGTGVACPPISPPNPPSPCGEGGAATAAQITGPVRITFDHWGNLFINGGGGFNRILKVTPGTNGVLDGLVLQSPLGSCTAPLVIVAGTRWCYDPGEIITRVVGTGVAGYGVRCSQNSELACKTDSDCGAGNTCSVGDGVPALEARITGALRGSIFDAEGNFYFSDATHRVRKVTARVMGGAPQPLNGTEIVTDFAGTGVMGYGTCSNNPALSCTADIQCGAGNTCSGDNIPAIEAQFNSPRGLEFDASEANLYITDTANHRIRKVNMATGIITTAVGTGVACSPANAVCGDGFSAKSAQIINPTSVSMDSLGNLFVSLSNNRVRKVDSEEIITTIAGDGVAGFSGDGGPAVLARFNMLRGSSMDLSDNLYIPDVTNSRIRRLNLATPVDVDPDTLNIAHSNGQWVTAYIQFPEGWDASKVKLDSVMLQAIDPANGAVRHSPSNEVLQTPGTKNRWSDTNGDEIPDQLMVKFDRATVATWADGAPELVLRVEGQFQTGKYFSGDTEVRNIY